jgi:hypothetical protein
MYTIEKKLQELSRNGVQDLDLKSHKILVQWDCWGEYLNLRGRKEQEAEGNWITRSCITRTLHQTLLGLSDQTVWGGRDM